MIRVYSDELIVLSKIKKTARGVPIAEITAETQIRNKPKEVTIYFYGAVAEMAMQCLVPGARFTFRGANIVDEETGQLKLMGATFATIA